MVYVFTLAGLLAATALQQAATLPPFALWPALAVYAAVCRACRAPVARLAGAALLGAACLGGWAHWQAERRLQQQLPPALENRDVEFRATLVEPAQYADRRVRLTARIDAPGTSGLPAGTLLQLNDYAPQPRLKRLYRGGQRWGFTARLKRAHGQLNPGGHDHEAWLWAHGVRATGSIRSARDPDVSTAFEARLARLRQDLGERIAGHLRGRPAAGLIVALVVGDGGGIGRADWDVFAATGVTHLVSISGLHITLVAGLAAGVTGLVMRWSALRRVGVSRQVPALIAALFAGLVYALLAGFSVPTQRTFFMLLVLAIARFRFRKSLARSLAHAALAALFFDPFAVLTVGFWLSFGAVACMVLGAAGRIGTGSWTREWGRAQWAVTVGLAPALIVAFQQYPWISPLSNAVAIPVVSGLVTPLALAGGLADWPVALEAAAAIAEALMALLRVLAAAGLWEVPAPGPFAAGLALAGVALAVLPAGLPGRRLGLLALLPLLGTRVEAPAEGEWRATVFDVGQGLAVLIETRDHALLYDTGPDWPGDGDSGSSVLIPGLRALGVTRLQRLVLSHDDLDHTGGAESLLRAVAVDAVQADPPIGRARPALLRAPRLPCRTPPWTWDGVHFRVLGPQHDATGDDNDRSCVVQIRGTYAGLLLSGDIGREQELRLVEHWGDGLRSDVLIAPHHGSRRSSSEEFIAATAPATVVFSSGYLNRFRHPHPDTLQRYAGRSIRRTDLDGAVTLRSRRGGLESETAREAAPRFWR